MSYIDSFPLRDRLWNVLAWAVAHDRLADGEADQIEATLAGDAEAAYSAGWRHGRLALALLYPDLAKLDAVKDAYMEGLWAGISAAVRHRDETQGAA